MKDNCPPSLLPVVLQLCSCFLESWPLPPVSALLFMCLGCPCLHFQPDSRHSWQPGRNSCSCMPLCRGVAERTLRWRENQQVQHQGGYKCHPSILLHLSHVLGSAGVWKGRKSSFLDSHLPSHCMPSIALWVCIFLFTKQVLSGHEEEPGEPCEEQGGVQIIIEAFELKGTFIVHLDQHLSCR